MNLSNFNNKNLFEAATDLFAQLGIKLNSNTTTPLPVEGILKEQLKAIDVFKAIDKVYFAGLIDDEVIENNEALFENKISFSDAEKKITTAYEGLMVFAVDLSKNYEPNRFEINELARAFNRVSKSLPVMLVVRYTDKHNKLFISFAACERTKYKQSWRQGEKVGKVSLLKDIDIDAPHTAHLRILKNLSVASIKAQNRKAIDSFNELYISWQNLLNISALNKAFYDEIIQWFNNAISEIKLPSQPAGSEKHKDFAIRLIARLIFIWFLKELKVISDELLVPKKPNGDDNDLIQPKSSGTSYYKFVLQNLFFNALNKDQSEREEFIADFDFFSEYFSGKKKIKELILACPFLNGGLFDENENDYVARNKSNNAFTVPDDVLLSENGLNSLLSRYKFTIAENTPLDEEVAVDPEMLGRIFENLLAEQSEDTKEAARSNAGAFYTPRPVVSYMCKNVLLRHLNTDITPQNGKAIVHKLLETTVIDPACGSGAFPMGMLEEMMSVLDIADPDGKIWFAEMMKSKDSSFREHISDFIADNQVRYVKKLGLLRNCLFGIDLLEYAVEITKLRCWLSLIVEQKVDFKKPNYNLKPLPNLEFKFYKRNSLLRTFKGKNINEMIDALDKKNLLGELVEMENSYFITKSDKYGTKDEIKKKIYGILEGVVDSQIKEKEKELSATRKAINYLKANRAAQAQITKEEKKEKKLANELGELAIFREKIKDYFIERVVFPGIFNSKNTASGFDMVIGNPPYVNTKLINQMGMTETLKEEYNYCDDLYNHFTIRGMELLKQGGYLSYITSDTFLTIQTKENMRRLFLGLENKKAKASNGQQANLFDSALQSYTPPQQEVLFGKKKAVQTELIPVKTKTVEAVETINLNESNTLCRLHEIINTPKAFAAMVDTAIFTVQKQAPAKHDTATYIDIRFPNAETLGLTDAEWNSIKESKNNVAGWEKILSKVMMEVQLPISKTDEHQPKWIISHTCNNADVLKDTATNIEKYQLPLPVYHQSINYTIFSPSKWNSNVFDKVVKTAFPVFENWWNKIATSQAIENNRKEIAQHIKELKPGAITILGIITDGGVGLQTGDNGQFVGALEGTKVAERIAETRPEKLKDAVDENPEIRKKFKLLKDCTEVFEYAEVLNELSEKEIRGLLDAIKNEFGRRVFGKGYMYRIISENEMTAIKDLSADEKLNGVKTKGGKETFVPYDKGDKDGNRWYLETPYGVCWEKSVVQFLQQSPEARWQGEQFFFRNGFCWTNVLNPNSEYFKTRLKDKTVNDVGSMSLYDEAGLGDKYFVITLNSYFHFKFLREFLNSSVNIQINDIRKLPIKIPTEKQLQTFNEKFDACYKIKKQQFAGELNESQATALLKPIEREIDRLVEELYGIN